MKKQVIAYLHTHWDREWYRTKEEFNLRLLEVFDEILKELENNLMPCFYFDGQTAALSDYLKFRPEKIEKIKKFIKDKKLYIGPFYASADSFLVCTASLVRNLDIGIKYSKEFGVGDFIGYLPDTFGHSKGIFDILNAFNIKEAILWRGAGDIPSDFTANGIKTTRLVQGYFMDILHSSKPCKDKALELENVLDKIAKFSSNVLLLPVGADHLAVLKDSNKMINEINRFLKNYEIKLSSPFEYFEKVNYTNFSYSGEFLNNSETYILPGVYSSRIPQKVCNAKIQHNLFKVIEPLDYFLGNNYKPSLDYASYELIKNHAHDSIYGCSIDEVHKHVQDRFDKVNEIVNGVKHRLIRDFKCKVSENDCAAYDNGKKETFKSDKKKQNVGIFNLSNRKYTGPLRLLTDKKRKDMQLIRKYKGFCDEILYDTRKIPVTEDFCTLYEYITEVKDIPAFSFSVLKDVKYAHSLEIGENKIANSFLELTLERKGEEIIVNFKDKINNEFYNDALHILLTQDKGDSYNFAPGEKPHKLKLLKTKITEKGPCRVSLRLVFEQKISVDISLLENSKYFDFSAKIKNDKKNRKIQVSFKTKNPINSTIAEDTTGIVQREHNPSYNLFDNMPVKTRGELKTNSYPMQRFVMANDFNVLTLGLNEYEIYKNELKITLLRATGIISNPKNPARFVPAGPPLDTPDLQCMGCYELNFALGFKNTTDEMFKLADIFMYPVVSFFTDSITEEQIKFMDIPEKNIIFYGLRRCEDSVYGIFYNISNDAQKVLNTVISPNTLAFVKLD